MGGYSVEMSALKCPSPHQSEYRQIECSFSIKILFIATTTNNNDYVPKVFSSMKETKYVSVIRRDIS